MCVKVSLRTMIVHLRRVAVAKVPRFLSVVKCVLSPDPGMRIESSAQGLRRMPSWPEFEVKMEVEVEAELQETVMK